ncbi:MULTISPECIES: helix-turn-helix domain-containing protein [Empedobacter]|uniref:helix-turn-helix domain-containing protein n=1 Tax=Empedobacter TaxID=59734 RepID=UPI0025C05712|nr:MULTISPECIES: helix-turn-helix transcriptional regulator [unclassified Empedobacter]
MFDTKRQTFLINILNYMKINRLDIVFKERNVQNRVIAKFIGKTEFTISKWRNNKRQPSLEELIEIAKLLRVSIYDLIEPTNWDNEKTDTYEEFVKKVKDIK